MNILFMSTKKKIGVLLSICLSLILIFIIMFQLGTFATTDDPGKLNPDSYWSTKNAPQFYGATKITLKTCVISSFDPLDTRFRIFARDFEDGDLTPSIITSGSVDSCTSGTYNLKYTVTDSHNNTTTLTVPVIVTNDATEDISVERTVYTNPSTWAVGLSGFSRGGTGDRQILGIYLPAGETAKMRIIEADGNMGVAFLANDSAKESSVTIPVSGDWVTLKNTKSEVDYDSVPLLTSTVLSKENTSLTKTYTIEVAYSSSIPKLNYYHYKDDEDLFRSEWIEANTTYGVVDNEVMMVIVPLTDLNKTTNYYKKGFTSLDQFLEYYKAAVDKMDEYVGLSFNPEKITDQNVRIKYLVKANAHGAGAAYYSGSHVGINSSSVASFFEMNWGGLHEFAHGYQGNLGKGQMGLGEVGNNIIGHYIQIDKSIYFHSGDWLGALASVEASKNALRESGSTFAEVNVSTRLYMIINLFDAFEGGTTYGRMFSWFREQRNNGTLLVDVNANQDIYALAIADLYNINIIPYMEAWGLTISEVTKDEIYSHNYESMTILKDMTTDESLEKIMGSNDDITLKYQPVLNSVYQDNDINGTLKLTFDIDDINNLIGKNIVFKDGENIIKTVEITSANMTIEMPVGNYLAKMPILNNYRQDNLSVTIKEDGENAYTYTYENLESITYANNQYLRVLGYNYNTIGYQIVFTDEFTKGTITYPNQSAMGGKEYVRIYDENNNLVDDETVTNGYFNYSNGSRTIDLKEGYVIEVNYPSRYASKVKVYSSLTNEELTAYKPTSQTTRYIVTKEGLKLESMSDEDLEDIAYNSLKTYLINIIEAYKNSVTEEELNNKNINFKGKADVVAAYNNLKDEDRSDYTDLINRIKRGGLPVVSTSGNTQFKANSTIDLYSLITIEDNEDGIITSNEDNVAITTSLDNTKVGTYKVTYQVKDSDGNITIYSIDVEIISSGDITTTTTTTTTTKTPTTSTTTTTKAGTTSTTTTSTTTKAGTTSTTSTTTTKNASTTTTVKPTDVITTTSKKSEEVTTTSNSNTTTTETTTSETIDNKVEEVVNVPATSASSTLIKVIGLLMIFISSCFMVNIIKKNRI